MLALRSEPMALAHWGPARMRLTRCAPASLRRELFLEAPITQPSRMQLQTQPTPGDQSCTPACAPQRVARAPVWGGGTRADRYGGSHA